MNITKEAMKAETRLRHIREKTEATKRAVADAWAAREAEYIASLLESVLAVLIAARVYTPPLFDDGSLVQNKDLIT